MTSVHDKDYYSLLQVEPEADNSVIRKAYRRAALRAHPDKPGGCAEDFQAVAKAFEVLSCPHARKMYDRQRFSILRHLGGLRPFVNGNTNLSTERKLHRPTRSQLKSKFSQACSRPSKRKATPKPFHLRSNTDGKPDLIASLYSKSSSRTMQTLSNLQQILRSMDQSTRASAIKDMPSPVRVALLTFMQKQHSEGSNLRVGNGRQTCHKEVQTSGSEKSMRTCRMPLSGFSGVRAVSTRLYKAYTDIKFLRLYSCGLETMEGALEQHIMLVELRHALRAEAAIDPEFWHSSEKVQRICASTLEDLGISEQELGLRTFVSFRAEEWLGRDVHITSPVMTLSEAVELQSRVLTARQTSWEALRAEWIKLMRAKKRCLSLSMSSSEAERLADAARQRALKKSLGSCVRKASCALQDESRQKTRLLIRQAHQRKLMDRQLRLDKRAANTALREVMIAKRRWFRTRDLTTDELLHGQSFVRAL